MGSFLGVPSVGGLYYLVFGTLWGVVLVLTAVNYVRLVADRRRKRRRGEWPPG